MAEDRHIYGEVQSPTSLKQVFRAIRRDVKQAQARPGLTELYKRAGYLITLTHALSTVWLGASAAAPPHMRKEQGQPVRFLLSSWADRGLS